MADPSPYFLVEDTPMIEPDPKRPPVSAVYLVRFQSTKQTTENPPSVIALPRYGLHYEKYRQILCFALVVHDTGIHGMICEWLGEDTATYKSHFFGSTPLMIHEIIEKCSSILTVFGSYHKLWWNIDKVLFAIVKATVLRPVGAPEKWPNTIDRGISLTSADALIAIQRYENDQHRPRNREETSVAQQYCGLSTYHIMVEADRRLPVVKRCCIL